MLVKGEIEKYSVKPCLALPPFVLLLFFGGLVFLINLSGLHYERKKKIFFQNTLYLQLLKIVASP